MSVVSLPPDQRPDAWGAGAATYQDWFEPLSAKLIVNALRLLRLPPGARLLDAGAGTGELTLTATAAGLDVWAVDFAPGMVAQLSQRLAATGCPAHVAQMDGQALSFASAGFDACRGSARSKPSSARSTGQSSTAHVPPSPMPSPAGAADQAGCA